MTALLLYYASYFICLQLIDEAMQEEERMKQQKVNLKSQADDFETEMADIHKRLSAHQKDLTLLQKNIAALETKHEQKRADRHSLLKQCKVKMVYASATTLTRNSH